MPRSQRLALPWVFAALLAACGAGISAPAGAPVPDPGAAARELQRATTPLSPRLVRFAWELNEAGSRVRGTGIARYEAPERLRIDLFGPRGETYLAAALVGDSARLPPAAAQVTLPSPALLWSALGVVRPPSTAAVVSATTEDGMLVVRYGTTDTDLFQYRAAGNGGQTRLRELEHLGRSGVLESVQLSYGPDATLTQARYRDPVAYRELVLTFESSTDAAAFPESVWRPAGAAR